MELDDVDVVYDKEITIAMQENILVHMLCVLLLI